VPRPRAAGAVLAEVLDFIELDREEGVYIEIGPREGFGGPQPTIFLIRDEGTKNGPARLHLDVNPTDRDQDAELARLLAAGARPVDIGQPADASWYVLADPEGNEFCLLKTRLDAL
jgi:Glyoxalase-like domain